MIYSYLTTKTPAAHNMDEFIYIYFFNETNNVIFNIPRLKESSNTYQSFKIPTLCIQLINL